MSFEKKDYDQCNHIQKCSFKPIVKSDPIKDLSYLVSKTFKPSYGTFWNSDFPTIEGYGTFNFDNIGVKTDDITLDPDQKTIIVKTQGIYQISFHVYGYIDSAVDFYQVFDVGVYINDVYNQLNGTGLNVGFSGVDSFFFCFPLDYSFQTFIPANSKIQLRNLYPNTLQTCDNVPPSAVISLLRIG